LPNAFASRSGARFPTVRACFHLSEDLCSSEKMQLISSSDDRLPAAVLGVIGSTGLDGFELEWRLGVHGPRGFQPGITQAEWEGLRAELDVATCWDAVHDIHTTEKVSGASKLVNGTSWIHKTRLFDVDYAPYVRVSGSREVTEAAAPDAERRLSPKTFTRFKQRRSYRHGCWSFDLTKVVSTADIDSDTCSYEVEIELADPIIFFTVPATAVIEMGHAFTRDMLQKTSRYKV